MNNLVPAPKWIALALVILVLLGAALAAMIERRQADFSLCPLCGQKLHRFSL